MHATRLILMLPPLVIITALGLKKAYSLLNKKILKLSLFLFFLILALSSSAYWYRYSAHYKLESARHWHFGYQEIGQKLSPLVDSANRIFINNTYEPSLLKVAFFTQYPPVKFQADFTTDIPEENIVKGFDGFKLGNKFYFGKARNLDDLYKLLNPGDIYLVAQGQEVPGDWDWSKEPPAELKTIEHTKDVFGNPLLYLITSGEQQ